MNRMMYVEGNPMKYGDKSGNNAHIHMFNQMIRHMVGGLKAAAKHTTAGARQIGRAIDGGARWLASGGKFSRNKPNDGQKILNYGGELLKFPFVAAGSLAIAGTGLFKGLITLDPALMAGSLLFATDALVGNSYNLLTGRPLATYTFRGGAILTKNSGLSNMTSDAGLGSGVAMGPFAFVKENPSAALIAHEMAHVRQYQKWGGQKYFSHGMSRIFGGREWMERNADLIGGTNAYRQNPWAWYMFIEASRTGNIMLALLLRELWEEIRLPTL